MQQRKRASVESMNVSILLDDGTVSEIRDLHPGIACVLFRRDGQEFVLPIRRIGHGSTCPVAPMTIALSCAFESEADESTMRRRLDDLGLWPSCCGGA